MLLSDLLCVWIYLISRSFTMVGTRAHKNRRLESSSLVSTRV